MIPDARRASRGARAREDGRLAEVIAAIWLMAKGYQILAFRLRTPQGEIDLLAKRGAVLAVIEVKSRTTLDEALLAVGPRQRERLRRAATALARNRASLRALTLRLDLIVLAPGRRPRHIADAWNGA